MNDNLPLDITLTLPTIGDGSAPRTITLPRAALVYLVHNLGSGHPERVHGAFGALGLGALVVPYLRAHGEWMEEFLAVGDRRRGSMPVDVWVAKRVIGDEAALARLRVAYGRMQDAWKPLQAFIDEGRVALGAGRTAAAQSEPFELGFLSAVA